MKVNDIITEDQIDEIDRRGFLKGLGAATLGATGMANAAPFKHGEYKDQMTGKSDGKYSTVSSDNSNAKLIIQWPGNKSAGAIIKIPGETINYKIGSYGGLSTSGRIKIGDGPVENVGLTAPDSDNYSEGFLFGSAGTMEGIARRILKSKGELKIEVPIYRQGNKVYIFTIEPDDIVKQIKDPPKPREKQNKNDYNSNDVRKNNLDSMSSQGNNSTPASSSYSNRVKSRILPNVVYSGQNPTSPTVVEIRASADGSILSRRVVSSSGNRDFDLAVERAIDRTTILPRDVDGKVPSIVTVEISQ